MDGDDGDERGRQRWEGGVPNGRGPLEEPDNFDCTSHTVGTVDLTVTKTASPVDTTAVSTGGIITYSIVVTNSSGTGTATNIPVRDSFETPRPRW